MRRLNTQRGSFQEVGTLRRWLHANGSLTARLRQHGSLEVRLLRQGRNALFHAEKIALQSQHGYVREVLLCLNGRPAVWARSVTSARAVQGPWKALRGLGARPLAELLFAGRSLRRTPLQAQRSPRSAAIHRRIQRAWQSSANHRRNAGALEPRWERSSVFWRQGAPMRVMEVFAPWLKGLHPGLK